MPFLTAGDPDFDTTRELIVAAEKQGADLIELGIPFSDPIADGPTIQASFTHALEAGATVERAFRMVRELRRQSEIPVMAMVSFSIVHGVGTERFIDRAAEAGVDGMIVPDLPAEEAGEVQGMGQANGLHLILLVAPTTPPDRARLIAERSRGFIYYVSVAGTTGARDRLPDDMRENIERLRTMTDTPIALGFGVATPEHAAAVAAVADGVIVGSAIVKRIAALRDGPRKRLVSEVADFIGTLAAGAKQARTQATG